jgi:mono/diheme cytochrome c family protein
MRKLLAIGIALTALCGGARAGTSVWDGAYSDAQAERGAVQYQQHCGRCHGANLAGTFETPPLVGRFIPYWSGTTLDVLVDYINTAMPLDHPGALGRAADADIVAFILKANNFPAGANELSADSAAQKAISFDAARPAANHRKSVKTQ